MIGIFGGTFDPVHLGHTFVIKEFSDSVYFDELILIPNGTPPHKEKNVYEEEKLEMTKLALGNTANLTIDDREVKKKAPSYAYSTLQELKKENPDDIACIIIEPIQGEGGDNHFRPEFLIALKDLCLENDMLLVFSQSQVSEDVT